MICYCSPRQNGCRAVKSRKTDAIFEEDVLPASRSARQPSDHHPRLLDCQLMTGYYNSIHYRSDPDEYDQIEKEEKIAMRISGFWRIQRMGCVLMDFS